MNSCQQPMNHESLGTVVEGSRVTELDKLGIMHDSAFIPNFC